MATKTQEELVKKVNQTNLFDSIEKWNAFQELKELESVLIEIWVSNFENKLKSETYKNNNWSYEYSNKPKEIIFNIGNTILKLSVCFSSEFIICVSLCSEHKYSRKIEAILKQNKFKDLNYYFDEKLFNDQSNFNYYYFGSKGVEFHFENLIIKKFDNELQCDWYLGNKTDEIIENINKVIKPFMEEPMIMLFEELNQELVSK